ncbi:hypothetical protein HCU40_02560 [Pseudanabaena biceps]|nr:hypothetical protein [Pseudanabaena biceps]
MKKLIILALFSSVTFCDVSLAAQTYQSQTSGDNLIAKTENSADKVKSTPVKSANAIKFDAFMKSGYAAFDKKDFKTALANFKSALAIRPNNIYATKAIQNTEKRITGK